MGDENKYDYYQCKKCLGMKLMHDIRIEDMTCWDCLGILPEENKND